MELEEAVTIIEDLQAPIQQVRKKYTGVSRRSLTVWHRNQGYCYYCCRLIEASKASVDHYIPLSKGGPDVADNRVCACRPCNYAKGDMYPWEFFAWLDEVKQVYVPEADRLLTERTSGSIITV